MKSYEAPEILIEKLQLADIIASSSTEGDGDWGQNPGGGGSGVETPFG